MDSRTVDAPEYSNCRPLSSANIRRRQRARPRGGTPGAAPAITTANAPKISATPAAANTITATAGAIGVPDWNLPASPLVALPRFRSAGCAAVFSVCCASSDVRSQ
ncbi:MAG: hypothetical protein IPM02_23540 [Betaproteobacteria bacterium]|nr:hypothetical protein [Betaproteobacteria bacterium]